MKRSFLITLLFTFAGLLSLHSQVNNNIKRPKITGVAHAAFYVKNIDQARAFYKYFLGFAEPYSLKKNNRDELALTYIKINDRQVIEIFPEKTPESERLYHFAIETDDAEGMRQYLASKGIKLLEGCKIPTEMKTGINRKRQINYYDGDGTRVEIMEPKTVDGQPVPSSNAPAPKFIR